MTKLFLITYSKYHIYIYVLLLIIFDHSSFSMPEIYSLHISDYYMPLK